MSRANYIILDNGNASGIITIKDLDSGNLSITNDAENVVNGLVKRFGNKRILYYDTMHNLDELIHEYGKFIGYKPISDIRNL